jgi:hypothetical protein
VLLWLSSLHGTHSVTREIKRFSWTEASVLSVSPVHDNDCSDDNYTAWKDDHLFPVLWFDHTRIPELRQWAHSSHKSIAARIRDFQQLLLFKKQILPPKDPEEFAGRWNEGYGNNVAVLAFYCLLNPQDTDTLEMVKTSLDIIVSQPSWLVAASPMDEVPVSHSLTGVAIALDFLWPSLSPLQRRQTVNKIQNETTFMLDMMAKRWWGKSFLQNHVWSNVVSIYIGGLMVPWIKEWDTLPTPLEAFCSTFRWQSGISTIKARLKERGGYNYTLITCMRLCMISLQKLLALLTQATDGFMVRRASFAFLTSTFFGQAVGIGLQTR